MFNQFEGWILSACYFCFREILHETEISSLYEILMRSYFIFLLSVYSVSTDLWLGKALDSNDKFAIHFWHSEIKQVTYLVLGSIFI